jgi:predicted MPP superfamily phosphohydrolase
MGWVFDLDHANLVNYLTMDDKSATGGSTIDAPRVTFPEVQSFLNGLNQIVGGHTGIISTSGGWLQCLKVATTEAMDLARRSGGEPAPTAGGALVAARIRPETILSSKAVAELLHPLKPLFQGYSIYALIIPEEFRNGSPEQNFFVEAALSSQGHGLILMPDAPPGLLNILDPFPAMQVLATTPVAPPAVVFWTALGGACALPLDKAKTFFREEILDRLMTAGQATIDHVLRRQAAQTRSSNLLHISDLHFGDATSDDNRRYIKGQLDLILHDIDRVVVTGDLFNTPDSTLRNQFLDFKSDIERMTSKPLIVIPGNHDVRPKGIKMPGILRQTYEFVVDIGWQQLVIDDDLKWVFFCFNSMEEGELARGAVPDRQRKEIASLFNEERARRRRQHKDDLEEYTKIALVHHHPFDYHTIPTARYDALLRKITGDEDSFTRFEEAERFVSWCAERKVSLILHGHKHVPHHVQAAVSIGDRQHTLVSVGCGSTTGAENSPLCYDVVSFDPKTGRWGVTFHYDPSRSGAGFRKQEIIADTRSALSQW